MKTKKILILGLGLVAAHFSYGQGSKVKLFKEQALTSEQYKKHVGEVVFSNEPIEPALPESKYIKTYNLGDLLYARGFFANSPVNSAMLQLEQSGVSAKEINQAKNEFKENVNVDFRLFFDGQQITRSDDDKEDGTAVLTYAAILYDNKGSKDFGTDLYRDLLKRKDLLTPGTHKLKIEIYTTKSGYGTGANFKYTPIAVGEIDLAVAETKASAETCFPAKRMNDPKLEAEVLKAVKATRPNAFKIIITSSEMKIIRDDYNNIVSKRFYATVVNKIGNELTSDSYLFEKDFNGAGYEDTRISKDMENALLPKKVYVNKDCIKYLK